MFFRLRLRGPTLDGPSGTGSKNPWHPRMGLGPLKKPASIPRETNPRHSGEAGETASIGGLFRVPRVRRTRAGQAAAGRRMLGSPNEPISSSDCETNPRHVAEARQNLRIGGGFLPSSVTRPYLSTALPARVRRTPWHPKLGLTRPQKPATTRRETNPRNSGEAGETASIGGLFRMAPVRRTRAGQAVASRRMLGSPNEPISGSRRETKPRYFAETRQDLQIVWACLSSTGTRIYLSTALPARVRRTRGTRSWASLVPQSLPQLGAKRTYGILVKSGKPLRLEVLSGCHATSLTEPSFYRPHVSV